MSEIKRARSDFLDQGCVLATIPPGDPAAAGSASSLFLLRAGRATAEAVVKATPQVQNRVLCDGGAGILLSEQVPGGERSLPGFYSLLLFSHHS